MMKTGMKGSMKLRKLFITINPKNFTFLSSLCSPPLWFSFSHLFSSAQQLKQGSKLPPPGPPLSFFLRIGFSASGLSHSFSVSLNRFLCLSHCIRFSRSAGSNIWALRLVIRLGPGGWFCLSVLGLHVFYLFIKPAFFFFFLFFFWVIH